MKKRENVKKKKHKELVKSVFIEGKALYDTLFSWFPVGHVAWLQIKLE